MTKTLAEIIKESIGKPVVMPETFETPKFTYSGIVESDAMAKLYKTTFNYNPSEPAENSLKLEKMNKIKERSAKMLKLAKMSPAKVFLDSVISLDDVQAMNDSMVEKVNRLYKLAVKECDEMKDDPDQGDEDPKEKSADDERKPEEKVKEADDEEDDDKKKDDKKHDVEADDKDADKDKDSEENDEKSKLKTDYTKLINDTLAKLKLKSLNKASPKQKRMFWTIIEKDWVVNGLQGPFPFMFLTDKEQEAIENGRVKASDEDNSEV